MAFSSFVKDAMPDCMPVLMPVRGQMLSTYSRSLFLEVSLAFCSCWLAWFTGAAHMIAAAFAATQHKHSAELGLHASGTPVC